MATRKDNSLCPEDLTAKIDSYLSKKMPESEIDGFEEHYFNCDSCFEELQLQEQVKGLVISEAETLVPAYFQKAEKTATTSQPIQSFAGQVNQPIKMFPEERDTKWSYWAGVAAAIVLLLATYIYLNPGPDDPMQARIPETVNNEYFANALEDSFQPLAQLEQRMNNLRDGSTQVIILSAPDETAENGNLKFLWRHHGENAPLDFHILNNQGDKLHTYKIEQNSFSFTESLDPGRYYWVLESPRETLHIGYFLITQ